MAPTNPPPWRIRTLADDPASPLTPLAFRAPVPVAITPGVPAGGSPAPAQPSPTDHLAHCPHCNRLVPPDLLTDVRPLPATLRAACGWTAHEFVCDGCRGVAEHTGLLTLTALHEAHGAPPDALALAQAYDAAVAAHRHL